MWGLQLLLRCAVVVFVAVAVDLLRILVLVDLLVVLLYLFVQESR